MKAIDRYAILDTPPEGAFDRITRLAAQLANVPVAIIELVHGERIWFKSVFGFEGVTEVPREPGLGASAIEQSEPYIVEDAARDPRSANNSLVRGAFGFRFYIGIPLVTSDGFVLGTLSVFDTEPRLAQTAHVEMLSELAKIVVDELELRLTARRLAQEASRREYAEAKEAVAARFSLTDDLTGLLNRRALERHLDSRFDAMRRGEPCDGAVAVLDIDGLKAVNDRRGHDVGDELLRAFGGSLAGVFPADAVFRYGGDEFVIVFDSALESTLAIRKVLAAVRAVREGGFSDVDASFGLAAFAEVAGSPREALRLADSRMYAVKISRR